MKKIVTLFLAVMMVGVWCVGVAGAATEGQKQQAIDDGLAWLAGQQQAGGYWNYGGTPERTAVTASALLAFTEQRYKPLGWNGQNYSANVTNALNYILMQAQPVTIGLQGTNDPDTNGNGLGYKFVVGGITGRDTYVTGLVLPALARVTAGINGITPSTVINLPGYAVNGLTYGQVIQDTVDYFAWGQNESGTARGGWRYYANSGDSDNSTAQWPAMGMLFAQNAGATVPQFVKNELKIWIDYIQNANGGSGYDDPNGGGAPISESKTGGLLVEMAFAGYYGGTAPNSNTALSYLNTNWQNGANGWNGNFGHPYAMWSIYKGLEVTIGLDADTSVISNLHPAATGDYAIDNPNHGWNWWEDYSDWLVQNQNGDGSWTGYPWNNYWPNLIATPWNINILNATVIQQHDGVPEPATLLLLGLGLAGLGVIRRKR